jgi:hypothetical protein
VDVSFPGHGWINASGASPFRKGDCLDRAMPAVPSSRDAARASHQRLLVSNRRIKSAEAPRDGEGTLILPVAFISGASIWSAAMEDAVWTYPFEPADVESAVRACAHDQLVGKFVSTSHAVEELRMRTGDFVTPDEALANALSAVAVRLGCAIIFDEQAGAEVLKVG